MNEELLASINANSGVSQQVHKMSSFRPSDDRFDTSPYTDAEYIQLLKKEISHLQIKLSNQEKYIDNFKLHSGGNSIVFSECSDYLTAKEANWAREVEVPQRSARRNEESHLQVPVGAFNLVTSFSQKNAHGTKEGTSFTGSNSNGPFQHIEAEYLSPEHKNESLSSANLFKRGKIIEARENKLAPTQSLYNSEDDGIELVKKTSRKEIFFGDLHDNASSLRTSQFAPAVRQQFSNMVSNQSFFKQPTSPSTNGLTSEAPLLNQATQRDTRNLSTPLTQLHRPPEEYNCVTSEPLTPITHEFLVENNDFSTPENEKSTRGNNYMCTLNSKDADFKSSNFHIFSATSEANFLESGDMKSTKLASPQNDEEDDTLFIKPKDFFTIRIHVVSTISANLKSAEENSCTLSVNDRETDKEMWRIRKSYAQIVCFDATIRPFIEFFGLPSLPDRSTFSSAIPAKVAFRSEALQKYFDTIMCMPHIPKVILLKICRYMSVDFVNPLDDFRSGAKKEGFLIRRYKGLGTTWKVRWCQIDGPVLEIYDTPGGLLIEQIKLSRSQIGRQSSDFTAEDRGYRHAFLILEPSKSSKLSTHSPKHFFCAESDSERDEWIEAMVEFTENDSISSDDRSVKAQQQHVHLQNTLTHIADNIDQQKGDISKFNRLKDSSISVSETTADRETIHKPTDDQIPRQARKTKIRHLFPFRSTRGQAEEPAVNSLAAHAVILDEPSAEPDMQIYLNKLDLAKESSRAIFGRDLSVIYTLSSHDYEETSIPSICFRCFEFLRKAGAIYEEGIFRLSGSASAIRSLKDSFNEQLDIDLFQSPLKPDVHTVAGLLKTFLRELPHSIFGDTAYYEIQKIFTENRKSHSLSEISLKVKEFVQNSSQVDEVHFNLSFAVLGFLRLVIANSSANKMSLKNVCIVFVPTLNISVDILSLCLTDFDCIFADFPPVQDNKREVLDLSIPLF